MDLFYLFHPDQESTEFPNHPCRPKKERKKKIIDSFSLKAMQSGPSGKRSPRIRPVNFQLVLTNSSTPIKTVSLIAPQLSQGTDFLLHIWK